MLPISPVPESPGAFVGRQQSLQNLKKMLSSPGSAIGLHGPPGVGKSRLARHFALHHWSDEPKVIFVDGRRTPGEADFLDALVHQLDLPNFSGLRDSSASQSRLARALEARSGFLLLLDNVDHLRATIEELLETTSGLDDLRILVTTRKKLSTTNLKDLRLPRLSHQEAAHFFGEIARQTRPDFDPLELEPTLLKELLQALDHLPLALELAARRLTIFSPSDLLTRLEERFQLLAPPVTSPRTSPIALEESIQWTWDTLSEEDRLTLGQCCVFRGDFGLEAAEAILSSTDDTGDQRIWVADLLQNLVEHSLVETAADPDSNTLRFSLLKSIEDFAKARTDSRLLDQATDRHAEVYYRRAQQWAENLHNPSGGESLRAIFRERANLLAAVDHLTRGAPSRAMELLCWLEPAFRFRGSAAKFLQRLNDCSEHRPSSSTPWPIAREALTRAITFCQTGDFEAALTEVERALQSLDDDPGPQAPHRSEVYHCRGDILRQLGRTDDAYQCWQQGLRLSPPPFFAHLLHQSLGLLELHRARFGPRESSEQALERSLELLRKAFQYSQEHTHPFYHPPVTTGWVIALHMVGDSQRALTLLRRETRTQSQLGYTEGEARCLHFLSMLESELGDPAKAIEFAERLDHYFQNTAMLSRRARNMTLLSTLNNRIARLDEASRWAEQSLDACAAVGLRIPKMTAHFQAMQIAWERGDLPTVATHGRAGLELSDALGSRSPGSVASAYLSFLLAQQGDLDDAREQNEEAIERLKESAEARRPKSAPRWHTIASAWRAILELSAAEHQLHRGDWDPLYGALTAVNQLQQAPNRGYTAVARRHAEQIAERVRLTYGLPRELPQFVLRTDRLAFTYALDDQPPVDLSNRGPLRRIMDLLVTRRFDDNTPATLEEVVCAGWPDEALEPQSAASRVYSTIYLLRQLGLEDVVEHRDQGYQIAPNVLVLPSPLPNLFPPSD